MRSENKNFLLNVVYQGLTLVFPLVTVPYISRVLGVDNVGIYSYTYSIAYMFMLGGMLGINNYGTRSIARVRDDRAATSAEFASIYCLQVVLNLVAVCGYAVYVVVFGAAYRTIALVQLVHVLSICFDVNWFYFGLEQFKVTIARNLVELEEMDEGRTGEIPEHWLHTPKKRRKKHYLIKTATSLDRKSVV